MKIPRQKLEQVLERFDAIEARMGVVSEAIEIVKLAKEHAELRPVADGVRNLREVLSEMEDLEEMASDPEMAAMAKDELQTLKEKLPALEKEVSILLFAQRQR